MWYVAPSHEVKHTTFEVGTLCAGKSKSGACPRGCLRGSPLQGTPKLHVEACKLYLLAFVPPVAHQAYM